MLKGAGYLILPEQTCNVQGRVETMPFCLRPNPFDLSADSVMAYKPAVFWEVRCLLFRLVWPICSSFILQLYIFCRFSIFALCLFQEVSLEPEQTDY